jgi:hypothetical protein
MAVLSLLQVFAPYAPVELLAKKEDAARALKALRHLLLGDEAPERGETKAPAPRAAPWSAGSRVAVLGAAAAAAGAALVLANARSVLSHAPSGPRPELEVVRIDDALDAFENVGDERIPELAGIDIYQENVPDGPGRSRVTHFARIVRRNDESKHDAIVRLRRWLETIPLPPDARFGIEDVAEFDSDTFRSTIVGARTHVLRGPSVLRTEDITDAEAVLDPDRPPAYVLVTLSPQGARRFEDCTREWTQRRLAILIDGEINSAPVVKTAIKGGRLSITMGAGDPGKQLSEAKDLAQSLRGR